MTKKKLEKLQELKKTNPKVDEAQAEEVLKAVETVRAQRGRVRRYSLRSPFRVRIGGLPRMRNRLIQADT